MIIKPHIKICLPLLLVKDLQHIIVSYAIILSLRCGKQRQKRLMECYFLRFYKHRWRYIREEDDSANGLVGRAAVVVVVDRGVLFTNNLKLSISRVAIIKRSSKVLKS